jgi:alanine racemase
LRRGEKVGYGGEFTAKRATRIGVAVGGYGDGYPRAAWRGGAFFALVKTSRGEYAAPLAGRVSMDLLALDISDLPAGIGDEVVLWGDSPGVDELAAAAGTIGYEILAGASARIRRVYR